MQNNPAIQQGNDSGGGHGKAAGGCRGLWEGQTVRICALRRDRWAS